MIEKKLTRVVESLEVPAGSVNAILKFRNCVYMNKIYANMSVKLIMDINCHIGMETSPFLAQKEKLPLLVLKTLLITIFFE